MFSNLIGKSSLERYGPLWMFFQGTLFAVGAASWVALAFGADAFSPETWGEFACRFPAEMWAAFQMISAALIITGLMRPVTSRRVAVGAFMQGAQFLVLGCSAALTGGQVVVYNFPFFMLGPLHLLLIVEALRYEPR